MSALLQEFLTEREVVQQLSANRIKQMRRVLGNYERGLGRPVVEAGADDFARYVASRVAADRAPNTVLKEMKMIRAYVTWLWERGHIDAETRERIRLIKPPKGTTPMGRPNPYTRIELERFWRQVDVAYPWVRPRFAKEGVRDEDRAVFWLGRFQGGSSPYSRVQPMFKRVQFEAIVSLALHGGLRRDEVFRLRPRDVHPDNEYIVVTGAAKNSQRERALRPVPWTTDALRTSIDRWLSLRKLLEPADDDQLWFSCHAQFRAQAMHERAFVLLLSDVGEGWRFHRMRHTAITEMFRSGYAPHMVQRIAGHSRLQQTLMYAEFVPGDVVAEARRASKAFEQRMRRAVA